MANLPKKMTYSTERLKILLAGGFSLAACWALYLCSALFGWDLLSRGRVKGDSTGLYLVFAVVATVIAPPVMFFMIRRAKRLYAQGVVVFAKVKVTGLFGSGLKASYRGQIPVTLEYEYGGKTFKVRYDAIADAAKEYDEDTRIELRIDPDKPSSYLVVGDFDARERAAGGA